MMTNNFMPLISMMRSGGNPMMLLQQMAGNDPRARQVLQIVQGKNTDQLKQMAENMARERGTTVEQIAQSLGMK
jgi:hypothetical protein